MNPFDIKSTNWFNLLLNASKDVYLVGGIVRDSFLNKKSKDIDLCVTGLDFKEIESILLSYGSIDVVGESFGVMKFKPYDLELDEPIDIALPRTEFSTGDGHKDFEVKSDKNLTIENDLFRRDFTINSIAYSFKTESFVDPYGGMNDLNNKIIRLTNPDAFADDPLRILRCIQFSSRFEFEIEPTTWDSIVKNVETLKHIAPERKLIELEKIYYKGNIKLGFELLNKSGVSKYICGEIYITDPLRISTFSDFIYYVVNSNLTLAKNNLKIDNLVFQTCKFIADSMAIFNDIDFRHFAFNCFKKDKNATVEMFNSALVLTRFENLINEFKADKYPLSFKDLKINGNDLMELDNSFITDKTKIGKMLNLIVDKIFKDELLNNRNELINFVKSNIELLW